MTQQPFFCHQWAIAPAQAKPLIEDGATVLDVRNRICWELGHVPGSICVNWRQFSQARSPYWGKLLDNAAELQQKLRAVGVCNRKPAIAIGNPLHWGREGRIVWMLRTLGHPYAVWVDGGHEALVEAGVPLAIEIASPQMGDFTVNRTTIWEIQRDELQSNLTSGKYAILDTRTAREYAGATLYLERRGGHIPGAKHLDFRVLLDKKGFLLPQDAIATRLKALGIERETPVVAYCTGGVRSAFVVAVLADLGWKTVQNYAGSIWEWSAADAADYPLVKVK